MTQSQQKHIKHHLTEDELDATIKQARKNDDATLLQRLCFVKNLYQGDRVTDAGARTGVSQATSHRWANQWNAGGLNALKPDHGGGRPRKLTEQQWNQLERTLRKNQPWTTRDVQQLITDEFNVQYSPRHVTRLIRTLGMTYHSPSQEPGSTNATDGRTPIATFPE